MHFLIIIVCIVLYTFVYIYICIIIIFPRCINPIYSNKYTRASVYLYNKWSYFDIILTIIIVHITFSFSQFHFMYIAKLYFQIYKSDKIIRVYASICPPGIVLHKNITFCTSIVIQLIRFRNFAFKLSPLTPKTKCFQTILVFIMSPIIFYILFTFSQS